MRHLISLDDLQPEETREILAIARTLKYDFDRGSREPIFAGQVLGLLFEKPSLRTRVSFEALMAQHGGSSLYLGDDVGWQKREPICDFIPVLTGYLDFLVIRAKHHEDIVEATRFSSCPIINGLSDKSHPCQALADLLTVEELLGSLENAVIAYVGDANNVAESLVKICCYLNVPIRIAAPAGYQFAPSWIASLQHTYGANAVVQYADAKQAVTDANIIYSDVWASMGQESEHAQRKVAFADFQVTEALMDHAQPGAKFLHCLPARRGEEVTTGVIDGPTSAIIHQANNRLHAQKGLVAWLMESR